MMIRTNVIIWGLLLGVLNSFAQVGEIKGRIFDELEKRPLPGAHVFIETGGHKQGDVSNIDGYFTIKPLNPGTYNLYITYTGFQSEIITGVNVKPDKITSIDDVYLEDGLSLDSDIVVRAFTEKLLDFEEPSKISMLPLQLEKMPAGNNLSMVLRASSSDVQLSDDGQEVHFRGARSGSSVYYVDGVKRESIQNALPSRAIGSVTVYTGGIPAKYGDMTGGVVIIESKSYFDYLNEWKARQSRK